MSFIMTSFFLKKLISIIKERLLFTKTIISKFLCVTHTPMPTNICSNKYLYYPYICMVNRFKFWLNIIMNYTLNVYFDALKQVIFLHFSEWYPAAMEYWRLKLQIQIYIELWSIKGPQGDKNAGEDGCWRSHLSEAHGSEETNQHQEQKCKFFLETHTLEILSEMADSSSAVWKETVRTCHKYKKKLSEERETYLFWK